MRLNTIWPSGKKVHLKSTCCKKFFSRLHLYFPEFFPGIEKLLGKFEDFFKNYSRLCMNPVFLPLKSVWKSILLTAISLEDLNSSIIIEVYMYLSSNYNICHLQYMYKARGFYLRLPHHFCSVVYFFFLSLYILCGKKKLKNKRYHLH